MVPGFKFRKNRFLSFMAFILTPFASVPAPSSTTPRTADVLLLPSFGKENGVPIELWVEPIFLYDRNLGTIAGWSDFCRFRLEKAYHYKMTGKRLRGEHEYVVFQFSYKDESNTKRKVLLQLNRSARNNHDVLTYLARDTVARLKKRPSDGKALKSITFSGDLARRPSIWNIAVLASVVHNEKTVYELLKDQQCYWFADAIFYILEKWAEKHKNGEIKHEKNAKRLGTFFGKRIYERLPGEMSIWNGFLDEQREKDLQVSTPTRLLPDADGLHSVSNLGRKRKMIIVGSGRSANGR